MGTVRNEIMIMKIQCNDTVIYSNCTKIKVVKGQRKKNQVKLTKKGVLNQQIQEVYKTKISSLSTFSFFNLFSRNSSHFFKRNKELNDGFCFIRIIQINRD